MQHLEHARLLVLWHDHKCGFACGNYKARDGNFWRQTLRLRIVAREPLRIEDEEV